MNVLMITGNLYPHVDTNSDIAFRLADQLHKNFSCDVSALGLGKAEDAENIFSHYGFASYHIKNLEKYNRLLGKNKNKIALYFSLLRSWKCLLYCLRLKRNYVNALALEYKKEMQRICRKKHIDCIVAFSEPFATFSALSKIKTDIPWIAYQFDPYPSQLEFIYHKLSTQFSKEEKIINEKASAMILPKTFDRDFSLRDKPFSDKIYTFDFPNVLPMCKKERKDGFDDKFIHCVFTGRLYVDIRNPQYTFDIFRQLSSDNIVFHIIGSNKKDPAIPEDVPPNVIFHGKVSSEEALEYMQMADILVNIGNTVTNMLPSKILTYISSGKPILNIIKNSECPTLEYTSRYPLALNIFEAGTPDAETVDKVAKFCLENKGKQIPFEEIEKEYRTCTPEYVGGQLFDLICKVVEK